MFLLKLLRRYQNRENLEKFDTFKYFMCQQLRLTLTLFRRYFTLNIGFNSEWIVFLLWCI